MAAMVGRPCMEGLWRGWRFAMIGMKKLQDISGCDIISLSTLVLNSRDRYEKKWQLNFTRLKTRLRISNI